MPGMIEMAILAAMVAAIATVIVGVYLIVRRTQRPPARGFEVEPRNPPRPADRP